MQTNLKIVNYLDVTFNFNNGTYCPYRKPSNQPLYINAKSNHPPSIIKQLPDSIRRKISDNSCNEDEFNKAMTEYETALKSSGHKIFSSDQDLLLVESKKKKKKKKKNNFCPLSWAVQVLDQGRCLSEG